MVSSCPMQAAQETAAAAGWARRRGGAAAAARPLFFAQCPTPAEPVRLQWL